MSHRIVLAGARSHRQGTGPFLAAGLAAAGAQVCGIVGTSSATVSEAQSALARDWQLSPRGYTDLAQAIAAEQADAVVICTPWSTHAGLLQQVAAAGCHCLVEKPMMWPASEQALDSLLQQFEQGQLLLQMVAQWPSTLGAFSELHGGMPSHIEQFAMRLSPISIGPDMITDSAPHFISMLQALLGAGDITDCQLQRDSDSGLTLHCDYRHGSGTTRGRLLLETCEQRPRPAWYQVNELRADREVELPDYRQQLVAGERRVELTDPMHLVAARFVAALGDGSKTATESLRSAHRNLLQLAAAWD